MTHKIFAPCALALLGVSVLAAPVGAQTADTVPPATGARVPQGYFGPSPSEFQKELIGPYKLMKSGTVDMKANTVTLPLYKGRLKDGRLVRAARLVYRHRHRRQTERGSARPELVSQDDLRECRTRLPPG